MKIGFSGDLCITGKYLENFNHGKEIFSTGLLEKIASYDFFVVNFEGAATESDNYLRKDVRIVNPSESIRYLADRNIKVFNLANNHIFDCGVEGFIQTKRKVKENGAYYFGAGEDINEASNILYLEKNGIKIALIGISHKEGMIAGLKRPGVFSELHYSMIKDKIREAKNNSDWVILNYHGGEEYTEHPSPLKRRILKKYSEIEGVDIIIAHHPHVLQGFEKHNGKYIFYSLGNFVFDISLHELQKINSISAVIVITFSKLDYSLETLYTTTDRTNGITSFTADVDYLDLISDFSGLTRKWRKEAFDLYFRNNHQDYNKKQDNKKNRATTDFPSSLKRIRFILQNKYLRTTYLNAYFMRFLAFLRLVK